MTTVAFETSTSTIGVCVVTELNAVTSSLTVGLEHGKRLAPLISTTLEQAGTSVGDLGLVVCGIGPGSFTGTRIGIATALGITAGHRDCGLLGVSSLDAAGHRLSFFPGVVVPLIDARKGRLYGALYRAGRRLTGFLDESPERINARLQAYSAVLLTGPAAPQVHEMWDERDRIALDPMAGFTEAPALLSIGVERYARQSVRRAIPRPVYLRPSEAEIGRQGPSVTLAHGLSATTAGAEDFTIR